MNVSQNISKHFEEIITGGNWTASNMKDTLSNVTWKEATTQIYNLNTIAQLTFHIHYFISAALKVLEGAELDAHDKFSFDVPPITSEKDWNELLKGFFDDAHRFSELIEKLNDEILDTDFVEAKYGSYYRNLHGIIEHTHYHLGQIVIIKTIISRSKSY